MMKPISNILAFVEYLLISLFLFSLRKMGLNNGCDRIRLSKRLFLQLSETNIYTTKVNSLKYFHYFDSYCIPILTILQIAVTVIFT